MELDGQSDADLVRAFRRGDARSFETLFQRYQRPVFNYIYRMVGQAGGEDLTQDVFLRVFSSLDRSGDIANFRAWLYKVASNIAISYLRKVDSRVLSLQDRIERDAGSEPAQDVRENPEEQHLRREAADQVALALRSLSDTHRQVLVLRQLQGMSYQDIAEVMELSVDAVTSLLHRARRDFRDRFQQINPSDRVAMSKEERRQ